MTEPGWMKGPPARILLATDLSSRCDRALDRSVQLAGQWGAELLVVHAVEPEDALSDPRQGRDLPSWRRPPDPERLARDLLHADLADLPGAIDFHVAAGRPVDVVLDAAARTGAGLIVTGVARDEPLGRMLLGDTVSRLKRKSPVPLLIARSRARARYRSITVATDFSPSSRHALEAATRFFPEADFLLFNAYDPPFSGYFTTDESRKALHRMEEEAADRFLAESDLPAGARTRIRRLIEYGTPEALLRDYVRDHAVDLTVVGSHGGGALYDILIGSTARGIVDAVPGDVLIVRDPKAA